jgi:hypothetical protein
MGPCLVDSSVWLVFVRVRGSLNETWRYSNYQASLSIEEGLARVQQLTERHGLKWPLAAILFNPYYLDLMILHAYARTFANLMHGFLACTQGGFEVE